MYKNLVKPTRAPLHVLTSDFVNNAINVVLVKIRYINKIVTLTYRRSIRAMSVF